MGETWIREPGKGDGWREYKLRMALCFPGPYRVGMANLGFLWVYHLVNRYGEVRCDRFFASDRQLNKSKRGRALETGMLLSEYDVVAFSLPYEGGFPLVPAMLIDGGVEPLATRRARGPLVIAGGMAAGANPEPIADFLDAVLVGEAEAMLGEFLEACIGAAHGSGGNRGAALSSDGFRKELMNLPGVYVPSAYIPVYSDEGIFTGMDVAGGAPDKVDAVSCRQIPEAAHSPVITTESVFPGMFLVEMTRGCPYRCRFCLAGHLARGYRTAPGTPDVVGKGLAATRKVGLIGTAFTRSAGIGEICGMVSGAGGELSFSSIRLDRRTLDLLGEFGPGLKIESIAVAPEVATKGLSSVVGKDLDRELGEFAEAKPLPELKKLRLYYLIGVPGETEDDVKAIARQAEEISEVSGWEVMVSATPMIPKPFTPMQWMRMAGEKDLKRRKKLLKDEIKRVKRASVKVESIRAAVEQAALARGDRRIGKALLEAARRKEGTKWQAVMKESGIDVEIYTARRRDDAERFPWEVISHGTGREELLGEMEKAEKAAERNGK